MISLVFISIPFFAERAVRHVLRRTGLKQAFQQVSNTYGQIPAPMQANTGKALRKTKVWLFKLGMSHTIFE